VAAAAEAVDFATARTRGAASAFADFAGTERLATSIGGTMAAAERVRDLGLATVATGVASAAVAARLRFDAPAAD
jgi:hypothetical protein